MAKPAQTPALAANPQASTSSSAPPQLVTPSPQPQASSSTPTSVPSPPAATVSQTQPSASHPSASTPSQTAPQQAPPVSLPTQTTPLVPTTVPGNPPRRAEWTNIAMNTVVLIFAAYGFYGVAMAVLSAKRTLSHEHKEDCFSYFDHNLAMPRDCPERLQGPRVSVVKRQTEAAHVIPLAVAKGIRFVKMKLEGSFFLRLAAYVAVNSMVNTIISLMTFFSIFFLTSIMKPDLFDSPETKMFLLFVAFALFWVLSARFLDNAVLDNEQ